MRIYAIGCLCLLGILLTGCASQRPVFYPSNAQQQSSTMTERDIDQCMAMADAADLQNDPGLRVAGQAAKGGAIGGVTGAAVGAVYGNAGRGAAAGAAGGAAHGLMRGLFGTREPEPLYKAYVNRCLGERGYDVIGWR